MTDQHTPPPLMTVPQAACLLGISVRSAYRAIEADQIPAIRIGRRLFVVTAKLYAMLGLQHDGYSATGNGHVAPATDDREVSGLSQP